MTVQPDPFPVGDQPTGQVDQQSAPTPEPSLTFPDLPRLELDQLLGQLVDRATEVMATRGRLRGLLHANR